MKRSVPTIPHRRKREQKTNYRKRFALLKSGKNRLVIRRTNKYIIIQIITYEPKGDKVIKAAKSKELDQYGWKHSHKNIQAAYLTGLLLAKKMKSEKDKDCIADFGLQVPVRGHNRLYAAVKGVLVGGLNIAVDEKVLPPDEELLKLNEKVKKEFESVKKKLLS